MVGDQRLVGCLDDDSSWPSPSGSEKRSVRRAALDCRSCRPSRSAQNVERVVGADPPANGCTIPAPALPGRAPGILEERDVRAGAARLVGVEEVVDGRIVLIHGLLDQPQAERAGVELDVPRSVAGDARDVVDPLEPRALNDIERRDALVQSGIVPVARLATR